VSVLFFVLVFGSGLLSIPVAVFFIEVVASVLIPQRRELLKNSSRPHVAVLVPAHNESSGLRSTVRDIQAQLIHGDRLLVVADNCVDDTAAVAMDLGTEVIERHDPDRIGKGFALDYGLRHLAEAPPEIVIIIDADCRLAAGTVDRLASDCAKSLRPVQALDLMTASEDSPIDHRVAEFAWRVKNWVRPLGLQALNLPCQLMGTGMAFPWAVIKSANLASGQIVEDLKLGLDLALARKPPLFCPAACVTSPFPLTMEGTKSQRERWERGQFGLILQVAPALFLKAIAHGNLGLLTLVLDLLVPPLTVLALLLATNLLCAIVALLVETSLTPVLLGFLNFVVFVATVVLAWRQAGRDVLPGSRLSSVGKYIFEKVYLYIRIFSRRSGLGWVRTDRGKIPRV
jgi:cellulose synthase/poly-beta-1,6-N-acetylglucosamine synthase-like glycosyltransferase